jgi:rare lipoprotein A
MTRALFLILCVALGGCSSTRPGGYYKDDGPHERPPGNLEQVADAVPRSEPLHKFANRPYEALGKRYVPMTSVQPFRQSGLASWYGKRYHGQKTSSGETYDMYAMTAAHPTLPIPSYVRVTNVANRTSVVVRINDRGPFKSERVIDLSYVAAYKLGFIQAGQARVEVEAIVR